MVVKRAAYLALPILAAILAVLLLRLHANQSFAGVPHAKEGALALSD